MTLTWSGAPDLPQVPFGRLFRRLDRAVPEDAEIVTAYTDGQVTLRSNRTKIGYHEAADLSSFKGVEVGDFVVHGLDILRGSIGIADSAGAITAVCTVCEPLVDLDLRYVAHVIRIQAKSGFTRALARGIREGGADFRRWGTLAELPIPMPPVEYQRAVCDYLDRETARIDTLIEEQQRLIELLRERRAAVISSALSPTDSWVRRRIKHIGETSLGKMLDAGRAVRDGDQPRPYVRAADVRADGSVNLVDLNEMPFSDAEMELFDLRAGDVLLIEGGATVGRPGFMFRSAPGIAFQKTVNRLRAGLQTDARFVYWSMLRLYESAYYANHYGSVSFVHLTGEKLREIELHLPPLDEQRRIAAYLDEQTTKIDTLIAETERFVELARERRAALITAAVTGQIDVRGGAA